MKREEIDRIVDLWTSMFADDDPGLVTVALKDYIAKDDKGFPPVIGAIKAKVWEVGGTKYPAAQEAWEGMWKTLREKNWRYRDAFNALPPLVRAMVGSSQRLEIWSEMDREKLETFVFPNFARDYREAVKKKQDFEKSPREVKEYCRKLGRVPFADEDAPKELPPKPARIRYEERNGELVAVVIRTKKG